jgi:hypothetical protein
MIGLGQVSEGKPVEQRMIVRGTRPFTIIGIDCADPRFTFKPIQGPRPIHIVPFEFLSQGEPAGEFQTTVTIRTNLGEAIVADCEVRGTVVR